MSERNQDRIQFEDLPEHVQEDLRRLEDPCMREADCIAILQRISTEHPGFITAKLNLALSLLRSGDTTAAKDQYNQVLTDYPDELGAVAGIATVLAEEKDYVQAEELAKRALDGGYLWSPLYGVIAQSMEQREDTDGAAETYLAGYRSSPHNWNYLQQYCQLKGRPFTPPIDVVKQNITMEQLESLVSFVEEMANTPDSKGGIPGCDHTIRFAAQWADKYSIDVIELYQFLNGHGGFCDCEICFNVTSLLDDDEDFDNEGEEE